MALKFVFALCLLHFVLAASSLAESDREYLVKFDSNPKRLQEISGELEGAELELVAPELNLALLRPATSKISNGDLIDLLRKRGDISLIQPNFKYRAQIYYDKTHLRRNWLNVLEGMHVLIVPTQFSFFATGESLHHDSVKKPRLEKPRAYSRGPDPFLNEDQDIAISNAQQAWNVEVGRRAISVAILDTGIDYNHEDLIENIWHDSNDSRLIGWDFVDDDALPFDQTHPINLLSNSGNPGHGTHCAGNVGAVGQNGVGTSGIAQKVSLMTLRMLDSHGNGSTLSAVRSIEWAINHRASLILASWGNEGESQADELLKEAIRKAESSGILFVAAAGNTEPSEQDSASNDAGSDRRAFPASFGLPNIVSVAALNLQGELAEFSHYGAQSVDLAASGEKSLSTVPKDRNSFYVEKLYESEVSTIELGSLPWNGTSMAAPQVAGAAVLLLSRHPEWKYPQLKKRLLDSVSLVPSLANKTRTGGKLNVGRALKD